MVVHGDRQDRSGLVARRGCGSGKRGVRTGTADDMGAHIAPPRPWPVTAAPPCVCDQPGILSRMPRGPCRCPRRRCSWPSALATSIQDHGVIGHGPTWRRSVPIRGDSPVRPAPGPETGRAAFSPGGGQRCTPAGHGRRAHARPCGRGGHGGCAINRWANFVRCTDGRDATGSAVRSPHSHAVPTGSMRRRPAMDTRAQR